MWGCRYAGVAMGKLQAQLLSFIPSVVRRFSYSVNHLSMTGQSSTNLSFLPLPWMYILEVHSSAICSRTGCIVFFHGMFSSQLSLLSAQHSSVSIDSWWLAKFSSASFHQSCFVATRQPGRWLSVPTPASATNSTQYLQKQPSYCCEYASQLKCLIQLWWNFRLRLPDTGNL